MKTFLSCTLFILLVGGVAAKDLRSGEYSVTQTWSQETDFERPYWVHVP